MEQVTHPHKMFLKTNLFVLSTKMLLLIMGMSVILNGEAAPISNSYNDQHQHEGGQRSARSISYFHDTFTKGEKLRSSELELPSRSRRGSSSSTKSKMTLIPADDSLRQDFYPESVEQALGKIRIQRQHNRVPSSHPPKIQEPILKMASAVSISEEEAEHLSEERAHDLEEIFEILARRDGQLLEQMLSLKSAIERLYGLFEFMGIKNFPQAQRDYAIRQILERGIQVKKDKKAIKKIK